MALAKLVLGFVVFGILAAGAYLHFTVESPPGATTPPGVSGAPASRSSEVVAPSPPTAAPISLEPPPPPTRIRSLLPSPSPPPPLLQPETIIEKPINIKTVVGLRCYFLDQRDGKVKAVNKGSGVIISKEGHILTARHLIDLDYAEGEKNYTLEYCEAGLTSGTAPTPAIIRSINPSYNIPHPFPYIATLIFNPAGSGAVSALSDWEHQGLDFALLKITRVRDDADVFGIKLPESFEAAQPLFSERYPAEGEELITFGFPAEGGFDPSIFLLKGSVGAVEKVYSGDGRFKNQPFLIEAKMEGRFGRSGSPVFYEGYVIGIFVSVRADNFTISQTLHLLPIWETLKAAGIFG